MLRPCLSLVFAFVLAPASVSAGDGVVEINQTCANSAQGCFCGDAQFLPVTITGCAGRSYRLTSDLDLGLPVVSGIVVSAPDVSVDLGGFSIHGLNVCDGSAGGCAYSLPGSGVEIVAGSQGPPDRVRIENGSIVGSGSTGIFAGSGNGHVVHNVRVAHNRFQGIAVAGSVALENATATRNGEVGILVGPSSRVSNSTAFDNGLHGIQGSLRVVVENCSSDSNGLSGIVVESGSTVGDCSAHENGVYGVHFDPGNSFNFIGGVIDGCVLSRNVGGGIRMNNRGLVRDNSVVGNGGIGIELNRGNYRDNLIMNNSGVPVSVYNGGLNLGGNTCMDASNAVVPCP